MPRCCSLRLWQEWFGTGRVGLGVGCIAAPSEDRPVQLAPLNHDGCTAMFVTLVSDVLHPLCAYSSATSQAAVHQHSAAADAAAVCAEASGGSNYWRNSTLLQPVRARTGHHTTYPRATLSERLDAWLLLLGGLRATLLRKLSCCLLKVLSLLGSCCTIYVTPKPSYQPANQRTSNAVTLRACEDSGCGAIRMLRMLTIMTPSPVTMS